jgi:hypothetical protein
MTMNHWRRYALMAEEGAGSAAGGAAAAGDGGTAGAGAAAGAADAGAGAAGAGGNDGAATGAAASAGSVLAAAGQQAAGGASAAAAAAGAADPNAWLQDKFRVIKEDGSLDLEASARKVAEAHGHAEKRIGSGDLPPKTAAEYKVNVPEALADRIKADELGATEDFKGFMGKMHGLGLTQAQLDGVTAELLERSVKLQEGQVALSEQDCTAELRKAWGNDQDYQKNLGAAYRAVKAYGGEDAEALLDPKTYGNDPRMIRVLSRIGAELKEDTSAPAGAQANPSLNENDIRSLMNHPAYFDKGHHEHAAITAKVRLAHEQLYGTAVRRTGALPA